MDCRWVACLLLAGCFSDPPGSGSSGSGGSTGTSSATSDPASSTTAAASITDGTTSVIGSSTAATTDLTTTGSTTGEPSCVLDESCIPPPPPEWNGPLVGRVVEEALLDPMCPPGTVEVFRAGRDPAALCDCSECSSDGIACEVRVEWGVNGSCTNALMDAGCQSIVDAPPGQFFVSVDVGEAAGSACTEPTPGDPQFRVRAVACEAPERPCENGGSCVAGRACIWREGEHMCPPDFGARQVLYDGFEAEDLACDTCGCAAEGIPCDQVTLTPYADADCEGLPLAESAEYSTFNPPNCAAYEDPAGIVLAEDIAGLDVQTPDAACTSDQALAAASGRFSSLSPLTFCCMD